MSGMIILMLSVAILVICILELIYHGRPICYIDKRPGKNVKILTYMNSVL
ncbi:MAG: hypothetical protein E7444_07025 [Ruminococcaceae bacterium]|nr:hypothetical protein [Oscillospiraceae bacterium]